MSCAVRLTRAALEIRVESALRARGQFLGHKNAAGRYSVGRNRSAAPIARDIDLEELARELGVLGPDDVVVGGGAR
jgi:hypothetical protein